mmetsp:Transcript_6341/g.11576  ORF Transcript_6341/g.11576 Transcript_6341/m.11576 type:complete len:221 (-) Transcript_6341:305-967(-)|eukprot:CAMPEP_0201599466 /NCGR_PEP_ID=MMETSP0492-20130828/906_1 /ASSEMBLY_ACC=CAM_ASM_000837 /TAXON_ID=420259 /ORGANISM="Thalassiosira gravida, Strain GMp14c1" /LENGTH=220 /DNA_ID=CAMNT_0048062047 /DNA_START=147 /DNA_END=809 /DNA_ORIENTATION=-
MVHPTRKAVVASLAILSISSQLSSPTLTTLAFTPTYPTTFTTKATNSPSLKSIRVLNGASRLFYTTTSTTTDALLSSVDTETITHINDSNCQTILQNPRPVLVDFYVGNCGPCRLIDKSLQSVLPYYSDDLTFCKWNADEKENSRQFLHLLRKHEMTFRKLPTLILFVDGVPVAKRCGMGNEGQIERFLEDHLPVNEEEECVNEVNVNLEGEKSFSRCET